MKRPVRAGLAALLVGLLLAPQAAAQDRTVSEELAIAAGDGDLPKVQELVEGGASPDTPIVYGEHTTTALIKAADAGQLRVVKYLLSKGANVNAKSTIAGETPLSSAVLRGFDDVVEVLLKAGADVKAGTGTSDTSILGMALFNGQTDVAELLLAAGADPNAEGGYGLTPLLTASSMCNPDVIRWLVSKGAKVDKIAQLEYGGTTALTTAARTGQAECVTTLLELGANPHLRTKGGTTALGAAKESGSADVVALIEAALKKAPNRPKAAAPKRTPASN